MRRLSSLSRNTATVFALCLLLLGLQELVVADSRVGSPMEAGEMIPPAPVWNVQCVDCPKWFEYAGANGHHNRDARPKPEQVPAMTPSPTTTVTGIVFDGYLPLTLR